MFDSKPTKLFRRKMFDSKPTKLFSISCLDHNNCGLLVSVLGLEEQCRCPSLISASLVEMLNRILQDFLGSCKITWDPNQDPINSTGTCTYHILQDPVKSFRILHKLPKDPIE